MERIEEIKQYVETMRALHSNHGAVDKLEYLLAAIEERDKRIELMTLTETEREHLLRQLKYNQSKAKQANTELSAATKLVESLEKQIMTLAKEKEQAEAELEHLKSTRLESGRMVAEAIKKQEQAEARVKDLEKRLSIACHVKADDKVGFDFEILDRLDKAETVAGEADQAIFDNIVEPNCTACANQIGSPFCDNGIICVGKVKAGEFVNWKQHKLESRLSIARHGLEEISEHEGTNTLHWIAEQTLERMK